MSRIRSIKPEFFLDDELAELTPLARLLFIGLWTLADCEGRMEDRPKRIRAQILPFDDGDTDAMLQALHDHGFIRRYRVNDKSYLVVRNFKKHQRLSGKEAEGESLIPPPRTAEILPFRADDPVGSDGEAMGKRWGSDGEAVNVQEGKGRERKGKEGSISPPSASRPPARKTACPADLSITPELQAWADQHGYRESMAAHLENFIGKATAKGYAYADWQAALRNAIRDDWAGLRKPPPIERAAPGGGLRPGDKREATMARNGDALSAWLGDSVSVSVVTPKEIAHATN
jgi:hypothetical protein